MRVMMGVRSGGTESCAPAVRLYFSRDTITQMYPQIKKAAQLVHYQIGSRFKNIGLAAVLKIFEPDYAIDESDKDGQSRLAAHLAVISAILGVDSQELTRQSTCVDKVRRDTYRKYGAPWGRHVFWTEVLEHVEESSKAVILECQKWWNLINASNGTVERVFAEKRRLDMETCGNLDADSEDAWMKVCLLGDDPITLKSKIPGHCSVSPLLHAICFDFAAEKHHGGMGEVSSIRTC